MSTMFNFENQPYALIYRASENTRNKNPTVSIFSGRFRYLSSIDELQNSQQAGRVLFAIPFNIIREYGFQYNNDDQTKIATLEIEMEEKIDIGKLQSGWEMQFPNEVHMYDTKDNDLKFMLGVEKIIQDEISLGSGCNFVISKVTSGKINNFNDAFARHIFARLLSTEQSAYWTFLFRTDDRYLIGSSPERHISIENGEATITPISGTIGIEGKNKGEIENAVTNLLSDEKEIFELFMVLDEELKYFTQICHSDITINGPLLRYMSNVIHTEYFLQGSCNLKPLEALKYKFLSPTVVGSPLDSAISIVPKYEMGNRGFYSGVIGISDLQNDLDSAIVIRTSEINFGGDFSLRTGGSIVRDSIPENELKEAKAKSDSFLKCLSTRGSVQNRTSRLSNSINPALDTRNENASMFWRGKSLSPISFEQKMQVAIVNFEDSFVHMIKYILCQIGHSAQIYNWNSLPLNLPHDVIILGPGPGDPRDSNLLKIELGRSLVQKFLGVTPLVGICLGHQLIAAELGLKLERLPEPNQGKVMDVQWGNEKTTVGFYNSFGAFMNPNQPNLKIRDYVTDVSLKIAEDGIIMGIEAPGIATAQFHPESFLTHNGLEILNNLILGSHETLCFSKTKID